MMTDMDCEKLLLVQAEFDGEIDAADAVRAMSHRQECAICRAAYADLEAARHLMRDDAPRYRAPDSLRRALAAGLATRTPAIPRKSTLWREGGIFAAGMAIAAAITLMIVTPEQHDMLDQIVAGHVRALQPGHLQDVVSTDQHTVKPWFDGKLDFAPPVKDLATDSFPLLGGRLDYLDERTVAALVYRHDKHVIDLFIWPENGSAAPQNAAHHGYNAVHWRENGMNLWAVSDLEDAELQEFVRRWRATP
jgi:anti-sigma factor RsiW